jgi:hypothetical protein
MENLKTPGAFSGIEAGQMVVSKHSLSWGFP